MNDARFKRFLRYLAMAFSGLIGFIAIGTLITFLPEKSSFTIISVAFVATIIAACWDISKEDK